jgi:hypothetical protein
METQMIGNRFLDIWNSRTQELDTALVSASDKSGHGEKPTVTYSVDREVFKLIVNDAMSPKKAMKNPRLVWSDREYGRLGDILEADILDRFTGEGQDDILDSCNNELYWDSKIVKDFLNTSPIVSEEDFSIAIKVIGRAEASEILVERLSKKLEEIQ